MSKTMTVFELSQSEYGDTIPLYGFKLKNGRVLWQSCGYKDGNKNCFISRFTDEGIRVSYVDPDTEVEIIEAPERAYVIQSLANYTTKDGKRKKHISYFLKVGKRMPFPHFGKKEDAKKFKTKADARDQLYDIGRTEGDRYKIVRTA